MKKYLVILMLLISIIPSYSACWKYQKQVATGGGFGPDGWGGCAAYGDKYMYYLEKIIYYDTIDKSAYSGAISWQSTDAGKTFTPFYGYITNNEKQVDSIPGSADTVYGAGVYLANNYKIEMADSNSLYFFSQFNCILKTHDLGKTWKIQRFMTNTTYGLREYNDFKMYKFGFGAVTYTIMNEQETDQYTVNDSILITTDDFNTSYWSRVHNDSYKLDMKWISIPDTNTIYVTGDHITESGKKYSLLYKTLDKGKSWERIILPGLKMLIRTVCFYDKDNGWIGGIERLSDSLVLNFIYKTTDGGKNWKCQMHDTLYYSGIKKILYSDSLNVFALGNSINTTENDVTSLIVYQTSDGGEHWEFGKSDRSGYMGGAIDLAVGTPENTYLFIGFAMYKYYPDCELSVGNELPPIPEELKVYPNPVIKGSTVTIEQVNSGGELLENIYLYDINGNELKNKFDYTNSNSGQLSIKLSNDISSGAYMIVLQYGINRIKYCKVVVE